MMPDGEDETDESAQLLDMLRDPQALAEMPDSLLLQLRDLVCMKEFPKDIVENVRRECTRRACSEMNLPCCVSRLISFALIRI